MKTNHLYELHSIAQLRHLNILLKKYLNHHLEKIDDKFYQIMRMSY